MEKVKVNYLIDFLMFLSFLVSGISGFLLWLVIPSGIRKTGQQVFLGIARQGWIMLHNLSSVILVVLIAIHLLLHWQWIVCMTGNLFRKKKKEVGD